jgi:dTDP-4-amino-4,6-dideoxygalactose transaminase
MGERLGYRAGELPVTESVSRRLLRLPCFFDLDAERQNIVIEEITSFFARA